MVLTIERLSGSEGCVNYYTTLGRGDAHHEYYSEENNRPGRWFGEGAKALGLEGEVTEEVFGNLLRGLSPDGAETWVRGPTDPNKTRRAGVDFSFHPDKTFSAFHSQSDAKGRELLTGCLERASEKTLDLVTEFSGFARRGHAGRVKVPAKLVFAIFHHDTARPIPGNVPDCHHHLHCVAVNMAVTDEGEVRAWDASGVLRAGMKHTLGRLFQAELSRELREIGLETHRPERKRSPGEKEWWCQLTAVPESLRDAMSKRAKQVKRWMKRHSLSGWKGAQRAALETREEKKHFTEIELREAWRKEATKHGLTERNVEQAFTQLTPVDREAEAKKSLERALTRVTKEKARFSALELLRYTAEEAISTGCGIDEIRAAVQQALEQSPELVRLRNIKGERQWTTREMLRIEATMLAQASLLSKRSKLTLSYEELAQVANKTTLRTEQRAGLARLCVGGDISCVNGIAGAGKTFMMQVARKAWEQKGFKVLGTTLSANASEVLEDESGIRSIHIHKLLLAIQRGEERLGNTVLVVDEAGMVGTRQLERLTRVVERAGAKLVLLGDHTQLAAIDAGAPFRVIAEREGVTELTEIVRQEKKWERRLVKDLRAGRSETALEALNNRGLLFVGEDPEIAFEKIVNDWSKRAIDEGELHGSVMLAGKNEDCRGLNHLAQRRRLEAGDLGNKKLEVGDYEFRIGDVVQATRNNRPLLIKNGMLGTVTAIEGKTLRVRFQKGYQVDIDTQEYEHVTLAYARSVHKSQGMSVHYTFYYTDDAMTDREASYVAGSRFKGEARFYADVLTGGDELARLMERSRGKDLAHEHLLKRSREMV